MEWKRSALSKFNNPILKKSIENSTHLHEAEDDMLLILPEDEVVRLEEKTLVHLQIVSAPSDEVADVVPGEECARLDVAAVLHVLGREDGPAHLQHAAALADRALHLALRVLRGRFAHIVRVLKQTPNIFIIYLTLAHQV